MREGFRAGAASGRGSFRRQSRVQKAVIEALEERRLLSAPELAHEAFGGSGTGYEGGTLNVSYSDMSDFPSPTPTPDSNIRLPPLLGGLASSYASASSTNSASLTLTDSGFKTIYARIFDKDNGYTEQPKGSGRFM